MGWRFSNTATSPSRTVASNFWRAVLTTISDRQNAIKISGKTWERAHINICFKFGFCRCFKHQFFVHLLFLVDFIPTLIRTQQTRLDNHYQQTKNNSSKPAATTKTNCKVARQKIFKIVAIISYLLIFLMGDMIALPFFFWLLIVAFDFGNLDQTFAVLAIVGLVISIATRNSNKTLKILLLDILCFVLLASPLVRRMSVVPLEKFNYLGFTIPTTIFVLLYLFSIGFSVRQYLQLQKQALGWQNKTACNIGFAAIWAWRCKHQLFVRYCASVPAWRYKFGYE